MTVRSRHKLSAVLLAALFLGWGAALTFATDVPKVASEVLE